MPTEAVVSLSLANVVVVPGDVVVVVIPALLALEVKIVAAGAGGDRVLEDTGRDEIVVAVADTDRVDAIVMRQLSVVPGGLEHGEFLGREPGGRSSTPIIQLAEERKPDTRRTARTRQRDPAGIGVALVVAGGEFVVHGDLALADDGPVLRELDRPSPVVDHVVVVAPARHLDSVDPHALAARDNGDAGPTRLIGQQVGTLLPVDAGERQRSELTRGARTGERDLGATERGGHHRSGFVSAEVRERAPVDLKRVVTHGGGDVLALYLDEDLVEGPEFLRVSLRDERRVLIGQVSDHRYVARHATRDVQA